MFIEKLDTTSDVELMNQSLSEILTITDWGTKHQIGLNYREGATDTWHDATGSLYIKETGNFITSEYSFTEWNKLPDYLTSQLKSLAEQHKLRIGRVRFMRLLPRIGLSVHSDREFRYHFVVKTNRHAYIAQDHSHTNSNGQLKAICHHIPADSHWYKVDTRMSHWVYNGGDEERIHLVVCGE